MQDITEIFVGTNSKLIRSVIDGGGVIQGVKAMNFRGVLVKDRSFSNSLAKKLEREVGLKGFISTDELPRYGISGEEKDKIERAFGARGSDVVIFVADMRERATKALDIIDREVKNYGGSQGSQSAGLGLDSI
jgi:glutamyl-tRNA(Gln) amidotransferase subunit E